jgi:long-chain acyl-CoA synthetase
VLVSGFNVYPNEVEDAIAQMPSVLEVAVIGIPDATSGEAVRAYVVPNPDHSGLVSTDEVIAHCKKQMTAYKVPKQVIVRDELPKSPIGKVLRKELRAEALAELGAPRQ